MTSFAALVVGLLQAALSLLGFIQSHPEVPQVTREETQMVAQRAIGQATQTLVQSTTNSNDATFSADQTTGAAPLHVRFSSNKYATHDAGEDQHYVDFGDGTARGRITCQRSSGTDMGSYRCLEWGVEHTYAASGTYTAKLVRVAGCPSAVEGACAKPEQALRDITITATAAGVSYDSVVGMSKYTDQDFGFSFWHPTGWNIQPKYPVENQYAGTLDGESIVKEFSMVEPFNVGGAEGNNVIRIFEITSPNRSISSRGSGKTFNVRYSFDTKAHAWVKWSAYPGFSTTTADVSNNTMGGLHMFHGGGWPQASVIIPLSARNFVVFDVGYDNYKLDSLAKTVVALDPSVATPVSKAEQIAIIQAEQLAYGADTSSRETKTYTDPKYGFGISYPATFMRPEDMSDAQKKKTYTYMSICQPTYGASANALLNLCYVGDNWPNGFAGAAVKVSDNPSTSETDCTKMLPIGSSDGEPTRRVATEQVTINRHVFYKDSWADAGLGHYAGGDHYRTYYKGACLVVSVDSEAYRVDTGTSGDSSAIRADQDSILKSITFL